MLPAPNDAVGRTPNVSGEDTVKMSDRRSPSVGPFIVDMIPFKQ
jgi:hypothetical protein